VSGSRSGPRELAASVGQKARTLAGKIRRMIVSRADSAIWQVLGHDLSDIGGEEETREAEVFGGIGFAARPNETDDVEAIVAFVGDGAAQPIIIATRQEARRVAIADDLEAGETQIHNTATGTNAVIIRIMANGTVEIRKPAGVAVSIAKKSDAEAAATWDANHVHLDSTGSPTSGPLKNATPGDGIIVNPAFPGDPRPFIPGASPAGAGIVGTSVLKGQ
jgi:phage gp45-like